jgi:hypothetical protein
MLNTFHFLLKMSTTSKYGTRHTLDSQVVFVFKDTNILSFQTYHFKGWASSCVSLYKTQSTAYMTHQLMKDDFPAEWLPIRRTTIFFRGASRLRLKCSAILIKPETWIKKQTVDNKGSFQVEFCSINFLWKNFGLLTFFISNSNYMKWQSEVSIHCIPVNTAKK